jgi:hypothetical protein
MNYYGQKNYNEIQGINGKYRINQIGCFLTSFSNLLTRFGKDISPLDLNRVFRDRGIYIDIDDGIRDDLGWQSVTAYDGQVVMQARGSSPSSIPHANTIVKLNHKNQWGTHFCLVDRIENGVVYLVDSIDGVIRRMSDIGTFMEWASYVNNTPQPVVAPQAPAPTGNVLHLPPVPSWRVYSTSTPWIPGGMIGKEIATINPQKYAPLSYEVLGHPRSDVVTIKTQMYGYVNIYVGPETGATFSQVAPALQPAPIPEPAPVPSPVESPAAIPEIVQPPVPVPAADDWKIIDSSKAGEYIAAQNIDVEDLEGKQPAIRLTIYKLGKSGKMERQKVMVAGTFKKDGTEYYLTEVAATEGWWYGVPIDALEAVKLNNQPQGTNDEDDKELDEIVANLPKEAGEYLKRLSTRQKMIAFYNWLISLWTAVTPFFHKNK